MPIKLLCLFCSLLPVLALADLNLASPNDQLPTDQQLTESASKASKSSAIAFGVDHGIGSTGEGKPITSWEFDALIGSDTNKFWLNYEGDHSDNATQSCEIWGLYSRKISENWDTQLGARSDIQPISTAYAVFGFEGLAPDSIGTQALVFLSENSEFSARIGQQAEILWTERFISEPFYEINLATETNRDLGVGAGLSDIEAGLQTRYQINSSVAPYIEVRHERVFGKTADLVRAEGDSTSDWFGVLGVQLGF